MLKFDSTEQINKCINDLSSNCLHPRILLPTWIRDSIVELSLIICSEPLIKNVATGNITFSISDDLLQFFNLTDFFSYNYTYKRNAEVYDWAALIRTHFLMTLI